MDRLEALKKFAAEEPNDPFNHYALALEYLKVDSGHAAQLFEKLMEAHPGYLPTYYPYAQLLVEGRMLEKAEKIFQMGITAARNAGDNKTLREIQAAYNDWKNETD